MVAVQVGFVGWRGMVGSVLLERMVAEKDFDRCAPATIAYPVHK
jgi:aspartate-semialdehyde dehydrogenase